MSQSCVAGRVEACVLDVHRAFVANYGCLFGELLSFGDTGFDEIGKRVLLNVRSVVLCLRWGSWGEGRVYDICGEYSG